MTSEMNRIDQRQELFETTVEALDSLLPLDNTNASDADLELYKNHLESLQISACNAEPEPYLDEWGFASLPAKDDDLLVTVKGFANRLPDAEGLQQALTDVIEDLEQDMPEWTAQLEQNAKLTDYLNEIAALPSKKEIEALLDFAVEVTCPHEQVHPSGVHALATQEQYDWLQEFEFSISDAGVDTSLDSDYEYLLDHMIEAGTFDDYLAAKDAEQK